MSFGSSSSVAPDREQRRQLRDREAGRLRRESGGARDAGVHLDQEELARLRLVGELHVGAARGDADRAGARERRVAQPLQLAVVERLLRYNGPGVAGVTPTGSRFSIEQTTMQLPAVSTTTSSSNSCPALERALDEHLADRARLGAVGDALAQLLAGCARAAAAPERERRPHDGGHRASRPAGRAR